MRTYRAEFGNEPPPVEFFQSPLDTFTEERLKWLERKVPPCVRAACRPKLSLRTVKGKAPPVAFQDPRKNFPRKTNPCNHVFAPPLYGVGNGIVVGKIVWLRHWLQTGYDLSDCQVLPPEEPLKTQEVEALRKRPIFPKDMDANWYKHPFTEGPFLQQCESDEMGRSRSWFVYRLKRGTVLYHGTSGNIKGNEILERGNYFGDWNPVVASSVRQQRRDGNLATYWFAETFQLHHAHKARVYAFELIRDVTLLAMDHTHTLRTLREHAVFQDQKLHRWLAIAYPGAVGTHPIRRVGSWHDVPIMNAICKSVKVPGTASKMMLTEDSDWIAHDGTSFKDWDGPIIPPEVYFCNPKQFLIWRDDIVAEPEEWKE